MSAILNNILIGLVKFIFNIIKCIKNSFVNLTIENKKNVLCEKQTIPNDLILLIIDYALTSSSDFFKYSMLSKNIFSEMRKYESITKRIVFKLLVPSPSNCKYINGYNDTHFIGKIEQVNENNWIRNLDVSECTRIKDHMFIHLKGLCTLNMAETYLTEKIFDYLDNLENLDISDCSYLSGDIFKHLKKLKYLKMKNFKDSFQGFIHLEKLEVLHIENCIGIQNNDFIHLKKLRELDTTNCKKITSDAFIHLKNLEKLQIYGSYNITYEAFIHLKNLKILQLSNCNWIKNDSFEYLKELHKLYIYMCHQITDKAFINLEKLNKLSIGDCNKISDKAFDNLNNLKTLHICCSHVDTTDLQECDRQDCTRITIEAIENMELDLLSVQCNKKVFEYIINNKRKFKAKKIIFI